jgi:hypothetical protein
VVEGGGFEPPKSLTTDLQSVPFGRSGIPPGMILQLHTLIDASLFIGAPYPNRTDHLLITSQLLYQYELTGPAFFINSHETELVYLKSLFKFVKFFYQLYKKNTGHRELHISIKPSGFLFMQRTARVSTNF